MDTIERQQFDAMLNGHARALLRTAFLLTGDPHLAEDLLQTALVQTWRRWHTIRDVDQAPGYVRAVMASTSVAWWRRKWRAEVPTRDVPDAAERRDAFAAVERRDEIARALAALTRRQRAVLVLRFYEDLPEADVARAMGCTVGTVKSTCSRALALLRERLAGSYGGPDVERTQV